jgi:excisionase family DNA binding protein
LTLIPLLKKRGAIVTDDPLFTVEEVARQLGVNPDTVRRWIRNKEIKAINLGGQAGYRITRSALKTFLDERASTNEQE